MFKFMLILIATVGAAKAYDFSNSDYNHDLVNEIKSFSRQRGSTYRSKMACCKGGYFHLEYFTQLRQIRRQCASQIWANNSDVGPFDPFDGEKMSKLTQLIACEHDCFARAINVTDVNGKLNRTANIKCFEDWVGDVGWKKPDVIQYVDKCLTEADDNKNPKEGNGKVCSSNAIIFYRCMYREIILGCPTDLRVDSVRCRKIQFSYIAGSDNHFNKQIIFDVLLRI